MHGESLGLILFKGCTLICSTPTITNGINVVWIGWCFNEIGVSFNHRGGNYGGSKIPLRREGCHYIRWNRFPIRKHWGFSPALEITVLLYLAVWRSISPLEKVITKKCNQSSQWTWPALCVLEIWGIRGCFSLGMRHNVYVAGDRWMGSNASSPGQRDFCFLRNKNRHVSKNWSFPDNIVVFYKPLSLNIAAIVRALRQTTFALMAAKLFKILCWW